MPDIEMLYIYEAVRQATKYGNNEPLIKYVESGNPLILEDERVRNLIAILMRGESLLGRGEKFKSIDAEKKHEKIIMSIYLLNGYGIPIKSVRKGGEPDAITIVSERFHLSPDHIRKEIWNKRGANRATWIMFKNIGEEHKSQGHEIMDLLPPV